MFSTGVMVRPAVSVFDFRSPLLARIEGWPYRDPEGAKGDGDGVDSGGEM